jgi:hypothetical protein
MNKIRKTSNYFICIDNSLQADEAYVVIQQYEVFNVLGYKNRVSFSQAKTKYLKISNNPISPFLSISMDYHAPIGHSQ